MLNISSDSPTTKALGHLADRFVAGGRKTDAREIMAKAAGSLLLSLSLTFPSAQSSLDSLGAAQQPVTATAPEAKISSNHAPTTPTQASKGPVLSLTR